MKEKRYSPHILTQAIHLLTQAIHLFKQYLLKKYHVHMCQIKEDTTSLRRYVSTPIRRQIDDFVYLMID